MAHEKPLFSINEYDKDGDEINHGVFLTFGAISILVADSREGFTDFIKHLQSIEKEIYDNY